ncbi:MAG: bifunctional [glutamine synthetase] adenylyltransferase/[glutamine synthetase]-adenylyl-L-tyrosine phosphorylase, partial [Bradyrhizobium icense]
MNASAPGNAERHRPLAARFVEGPHVAAPDIAEQRLGDWLSELEPAQSAAIDALLDNDNARKIFLGISAFSPYLFDLVRADATRLTRILSCDPESHLAALIDETSRAVWSAEGETDAMLLLRRMKAEAALLIALCDIGGVWPVMRVTAALTDLAVASVQMALRFML